MQNESEYADYDDMVDEIGGEMAIYIRTHQAMYDGRLRCGVCGSQECATLDRVYSLYAIGPAGEDDFETRQPVVLVACKGCGQLRLFLVPEPT